MYQRRPRKFSKYRSNGRSFQNRSNGNGRPRTQSYSNELPRNNFRTIHNPDKLLEKYNNLAKEALSSGDKTLSENYLQHVDHFERIVSSRNLNQNEKSSQETNLNKEQNTNSTNKEEPQSEDLPKNK